MLGYLMHVHKTNNPVPRWAEKRTSLAFPKPVEGVVQLCNRPWMPQYLARIASFSVEFTARVAMFRERGFTELEWYNADG